MDTYNHCYREKMDKKLKEYIDYLKETIEFLENQEHIEKWATNEFLKNLDIEFSDNELIKSIEEPIDIQFREANFQVKTIYDEDRQMKKEYQDDLRKAESVSTLAEALNLNIRKYRPKDISIQEIANLINEQLKEYKLSHEQYEKIDMLFYFNRWYHGITADYQCIFPNKEIWERWRSVSMVKNGGMNFIYWGKDNAPTFIKNNIGKIIFKNKSL